MQVYLPDCLIIQKIIILQYLHETFIHVQDAIKPYICRELTVVHHPSASQAISRHVLPIYDQFLIESHFATKTIRLARLSCNIIKHSQMTSIISAVVNTIDDVINVKFKRYDA